MLDVTEGIQQNIHKSDILLVHQLLKRVELAPKISLPQLISLSMCDKLDVSLNDTDPGLLFTLMKSRKPRTIDSARIPVALDEVTPEIESQIEGNELLNLMDECIKWTMQRVNARHTASALHSTKVISDLIDDVLVGLADTTSAQPGEPDRAAARGRGRDTEAGASSADIGTDTDINRNSSLMAADHAFLLRRANRAVRLLSSESMSLMKKLAAERNYAGTVQYSRTT